MYVSAVTAVEASTEKGSTSEDTSIRNADKRIFGTDFVSISGPISSLFRDRETGYISEDTFIGNVDQSDKNIRLRFHVTDVKKPLLAVRRIAEMGNRVHFGPNVEDNYIEHMITGERINLHRERGIYSIEGTFPGDKNPVKVTVDSGAEDSVCPLDWGRQFGTKTNVDMITFRAANGTVIQHHGDREVLIEAPF